MTDYQKYDQACNRLWEKLEYHRGEFKDFKPDFEKPFLIDQLSTQCPYALELVQETIEELGTTMDEFQCSWAVLQTFGPGGGLECMEEYNRFNSTNLKPRP